MSDFVEVARLEDLPPGTGTVVTVAETDVAIFNVGGSVFAIEDTCPHQGSSLGTSKLDGMVVTCRGHGMRFNVATGSMPGGSGYSIATYAVKLEDGKIMVAVGENKGVA